MRLHVWCRALDVTTTPRQCYSLQELHWLPVRRQVDFKRPPSSTCHYPAWLQPIWPPSVGLRRKSSSAAFCHIKDVHCEANLQQLWTIVAVYGDRCFAAAGPKLWNSLPADLRQADISFEQFKQRHFCSGAEIATHCN